MEGIVPANNEEDKTQVPDLPVEIWSKILYYLKPSNIIRVQNIYHMWFDIVQHIIAAGRIKSDFYVSNLMLGQCTLVLISKL